MDSLEFSPAELGALGARVVDFITEHLSGLEDGPILPEGLTPSGLRRLLNEPLPRQPQGIEAALEDFTYKVAANSVRVGHPRFLGWTRPSPLGAAVYAEALAAALNQSVAVWDGAPAATEVELRVIEWLKELSGYAKSAGGLLTSGGSIANFVCLLAARSAADPLARAEGLAGRPPLTLYLTQETHYCVPKAAEMMGLGRRSVRTVPVDAEYRMDPAALRELIRRDRAAGFQPMAVAATLGTVNSGACDDLPALAEVCRAEGVWLHVDGAYGGFAALVPIRRHLTAGLELADSLTVDPHKGLYMPFEAGCALVRDPALLRAAFVMQADYLPNSESEPPAAPIAVGGEDGSRPVDPSFPGPSGSPFHFRDYGPQLSRSFRALKIYLALKIYGTEALSAATAEQYQLAAGLAERITAAPDLELLAPVPLGIVAFRLRPSPPPGEPDPAGWLDRLNAAVAGAVQRSGRVFLAGTRLGGRYALRACFASFRTREPDLDLILDEVRRTATRMTP